MACGRSLICGGWNNQSDRGDQWSFVVAGDDWARLWRAWRPGENVPAVDFGQELILVFTADGPNNVGCEPRLEPDGNVRALAMSTLMAVPRRRNVHL